MDLATLLKAAEALEKVREALKAGSVVGIIRAIHDALHPTDTPIPNEEKTPGPQPAAAPDASHSSQPPRPPRR